MSKQVIAFWQLDADNVVVPVPHSGEPVMGMLKLLQRALMVFLQEQDTAAYGFKQTGCSFMSYLRAGILRSEMDVHAHFALARHALFATLRKGETADTPDDECFLDIVLSGITLMQKMMLLKITLTSKSAKLEFKLPIVL